MFVWGAISHLATPMGMMGFSQLHDEATIAAALKSSVSESGMYIIPGIDMSKAPTAEDTKARDEKARLGPVEFMVVNPEGREPMSPKQLGMEFGSNVLGALIAAYMLSRVVGNYLSRVAFVMLLGILGWVSISVSYWNWFAFSAGFTAAAGIEEGIGWLLVGLAIAWIVPPPRLDGPVTAPDS